MKNRTSNQTKAPIWIEDELSPRNVPLEKKILRQLFRRYKNPHDVFKYFPGEYAKAEEKERAQK